MSQYISFFLGESKEKLVCELCCYSRSHPIFQFFHGPFEKVAQLREEDLQLIKEDMRDNENWHKARLDEIAQRKAFLASCANPLSEKMEELEEIERIEREYNEGLEDIKKCQNFCDFISEIIRHLDFDGKFSIFYGIEVPFPENSEEKNLKNP